VGRGQLIGESLRVGASLRGLTLRLLGVTRVQPAPEHLDDSQPPVWTFIGFELDDADAPRLADALREVLDDGPWYCNYSTAEEMWVVFAGHHFHYRRDDAEGRSRARSYARRLGVPEHQIDWDVEPPSAPASGRRTPGGR
jgi:hypothetical protein